MSCEEHESIRRHKAGEILKKALAEIDALGMEVRATFTLEAAEMMAEHLRTAVNLNDQRIAVVAVHDLKVAHKLAPPPHIAVDTTPGA